MKRSDINQIILDAQAFFKRCHFALPPFAFMPLLELRAYAQQNPDLTAAGLGWDVTDFAGGHFADLGLVLFTLRNGFAPSLTAQTAPTGKSYAEKIMLVRHNQRAPVHKHYHKIEDIINRGGGDLAIQVFASSANGGCDPSLRGMVYCDGVPRPFQGGDTIMLTPGESITLQPGDWHQFWGASGDVLVGEVSTTNDDIADNCFLDPLPRFADIIEDTELVHVLVSDYKHYLHQG